MSVPLLKKLKSLFFPVKKVEMSSLLSKENSDMTFAPKFTHAIVAETEEGPRVVNNCSKNYHLITNEELMTPLVERLGDYKVEAKVVQHDYSKFYTDFIIKDKAIEVMKKDMIFPRIRMNNSYDGSVKYSFSFGFYRLVCENGLTAPVHGMQSADFKLRHTSGTGPTALDKTMKAIEVFLKQSDEIAKGYTDMAKAKLKWDEAMEMIEVITDNTKFSPKLMEATQERLKKEMEMGYPLSRFLLYNALNYTLYNNGSRMKQHKKDKVDGQIIKLITNQ